MDKKSNFLLRATPIRLRNVLRFAMILLLLFGVGSQTLKVFGNFQRTSMVEFGAYPTDTTTLPITINANGGALKDSARLNQFSRIWYKI